MASRMSKYHPNRAQSRSEKNEDLYSSLYETPSYTNVSSVALLERTNEIDIDSVKKMITNREGYQKQREYMEFVKRKRVEEPFIKEKLEFDDDKNYDIRDVLNRAKEGRIENEKTEFLKNRKCDYITESRKPKKEADMDDIKESLKEIINTITSNADLNKLSNSELSLDLLEDLKAKTMVDDGIENGAIRKIIEDEKRRTEKLEKEKKMELDKSFYTNTNALKFKDEDFEDDEAKSPKKIWPKIIFGIIFLLVLVATIYVVYINIKSI